MRERDETLDARRCPLSAAEVPADGGFTAIDGYSVADLCRSPTKPMKDAPRTDPELKHWSLFL